MAYVIAEPCWTTKDKACVPACPVDCIYEGPKMLYIHPEECIDCGACVEPCPVQAIFPADELPEKWKFYTEGPVRCAPACWRGRVYAGSDDGYLYCLDGQTGHVVWKFRGAPTDRRARDRSSAAAPESRPDRRPPRVPRSPRLGRESLCPTA